MTRDAGTGMTGGSVNRAPYRPYIDGMRTVAVYSVVAFHAGLGAFVGGFIGVDVFFVLSGFLVTGILVRELQTEGRVGWARFYARRARRILPAAVVTLAVTSLVYQSVAAPADRLAALDGVRAAFLYFANWRFIGQANDYFAQTVDSSPVLHFWSLSIEEQFYFLWPLLLSVVFAATRRFGSRQWIVLRSIVASAVLASAAGALLMERTNLTVAYYGTHTRAYQLLLGAFIALTPSLLTLHQRWRPWLRATALGALVGICALSTSLIDVGPIKRGVAASLCAAILIVAMSNAESGEVARGLSWRPIGYLGRISYGTYLWHWPIVVIAAIKWDLTPVSVLAVSALGSTILAAVSYHVLEIPIRRARLLDRVRRPVIAIGLTVSVIGGVVFAPQVLDPGGSSVPSGSKLLDWRVAQNDIPDYPDCIDDPIDECTIERGTGLDVLLMGDSNARMWIPTFAAIARKESLPAGLAARGGNRDLPRDMFPTPPERRQARR
jgi:peptidoglycan/LPS O-acetylase OafA/YrhL